MTASVQRPDWSDDRATFYYADSRSGGVDVFSADQETGELGDRRRFVTVEAGIPDGLTLDADGATGRPPNLFAA